MLARVKEYKHTCIFFYEKSCFGLLRPLRKRLPESLHGWNTTGKHGAFLLRLRRICLREAGLPVTKCSCKGNAWTSQSEKLEEPNTGLALYSISFSLHWSRRSASEKVCANLEAPSLPRLLAFVSPLLSLGAWWSHFTKVKCICSFISRGELWPPGLDPLKRNIRSVGYWPRACWPLQGHSLELRDDFASAEKRQAEAARIRDKYPDRIPVSLSLYLSLNSPSDPEIDTILFRTSALLCVALRNVAIRAGAWFDCNWMSRKKIMPWEYLFKYMDVSLLLSSKDTGSTSEAFKWTSDYFGQGKSLEAPERRHWLFAGHCWEGREKRDSRHWQEEVSQGRNIPRAWNHALTEPA